MFKWPSCVNNKQITNRPLFYDVAGLVRSLEAGVAQSVSARPSDLEGRQFDSRHSIDVCFDFHLFRVAVALNIRKTEH